MRELLELECKGWNAFIAPGGPLTCWEQLQSRPLGGNAPTRGDDDSDDDDELDATTIERVLAAQAAAAAHRDDTDMHADSHDDEDDDEGGYSSSYIQHFAQYLSNRNFLNQTSDNVHDLAGMAEQLPPPPSEAWTAEFDLEEFGGDTRGEAPVAEGGGGQPGMGGWAADFSPSSPSSSSDVSDAHSWAAFDGPSTERPATADDLQDDLQDGPKIGSTDAPSEPAASDDGEGGATTARQSQGDSELAI